MARDMKIELRLLRWAAAVTVGDGSGFPTMSVLHPPRLQTARPPCCKRLWNAPGTANAAPHNFNNIQYLATT